MHDWDKASEEEKRAYLTKNIDRAVRKDWLKVYYQPVIRTLTGEVCGVEALARWQDPVHGLLRPDEFIPALEKARLIHKLDSYIIRRICQEYSETVLTGHHVVPVSFNLSRLDFQLCDIHKVIETAIREYKIPKDALHVEITESMMEKNEKRMHRVIDRFIDFGLNVWMDDFGSGYSSLNVLKNFDFDTIKIDMVFLRDFDVRSREIIKSVVDMAKRIGVHTLAEGVETEEQLAFLKSIGCEKAQGYLFSQPVPLDELQKRVRKKNYKAESPARSRYYHDIGRINFLSPTPFDITSEESYEEEYREGQFPLSVLECNEDGTGFRYLFMNENYATTLLHLGFPTAQSVEEEFARPDSVIREKLFSMMKNSRESKERKTIDFILGKNRCIGTVMWVADHPTGSAYLCSLMNLSDNRMVSRGSALAGYTQAICMLYERITLVDLNTMRSENLFEAHQTAERYNERPVPEELKDFAQAEIYPEDREEFLRFLDMNTIEQRIRESRYHYDAALLRIKSGTGNYEWNYCVSLFAGDPSERRILVCVRRTSERSRKYLLSKIGGRAAASEQPSKWGFPAESLWENFTINSDTAFFWKDTKRRYVGVNRKFKDYFGMEDLSAILGKTDEEIGWLVDPEQMVRDEEKIIEDGFSTYLAPGSIIRRGEVRGIISSKFPLYRDGKVIGLLGYMLDTTDLKVMGLETGPRLQRTDAITGSVSLIGVMESVLRYQDSYVFQGTDFVMIIFDINHFHIFARDYGQTWSSHLLREFSDRVRAEVGMDSVFGRMNGDHFLLVHQISDREEVGRIIERVHKAAESIEEIDDIPCTVYLMEGVAVYSDHKDLQAMLNAAEEDLKRSKEQRSHKVQK